MSEGTNPAGHGAHAAVPAFALFTVATDQKGAEPSLLEEVWARFRGAVVRSVLRN